MGQQFVFFYKNNKAWKRKLHILQQERGKDSQSLANYQRCLEIAAKEGKFVNDKLSYFPLRDDDDDDVPHVSFSSANFGIIGAVPPDSATREPVCFP